MGKNKKIKADGQISPTTLSATSISAELLPHAERPVRFSLEHSDTAGNYSIAALNKTQWSKLCRKLGHFENMTINQFSSMSRQNGVSIEKKNSTNHQRLDREYGDKQFARYGHFRADGSLFRVFIALKEDLYYLLKFDPDGSLNH